MVTIQIEPETGVAIAVSSGILRVSDAYDGVVALWQTPDWPGRAVVWDFREAAFELSSANIQEIAHFIGRNQPVPPPRRIAFVTSRDVDFGLARMFGVFREDPRTEFRVFRDYDEAVAWSRRVAQEADPPEAADERGEP